LLGTDAAIDLGTSRTRIYLPQQGVVIDEPSVVAVDNMTEEIIAIGQEAYEMVGRTSQRLTVTYPLVNGVISNFILVEQMVGYFLKKVSSRRGDRGGKTRCGKFHQHCGRAENLSDRGADCRGYGGGN